MKLAPYPKYKASGVEWPGEVPEHWEVSASAIRFDAWIKVGVPSQGARQRPKTSGVFSN